MTNQVTHQSDQATVSLSNESQSIAQSSNETATTTPTQTTIVSNDPFQEDHVNGDNVIYSRDKSDMWHEFHNILWPRDCACKALISKLLLRATRSINVNEEKAVQAVLRERGVTNFDEHLFFYKEYWLQRVRMPFKKGDIMSSGIFRVAQFMESEPLLKEYLTDNVKNHFEGWARRCRMGRYEQVPEVKMYVHDGYDSNGLNLWLRTTGTKGENYHGKLNRGTGPYGMGVEMAHYKHVLLSFKYGVNGGIRRKRQVGSSLFKFVAF